MYPDKRGEGDPQRRRPDISRAQKVLDWNPSIELEEGIKRTIPYFRENL
jgi:nucleoside-diphosphate-sugar epimerase